MPIRWRLAFFCAGIATLVLLVVELVSYSFHTRSHYDDLDRVLVANAEHVLDEIEKPTGSLLGTGGFDLVLRLYDANGKLTENSPGESQTAPAPGSDPRAVIKTPSQPAFDFMAGLTPPMVGMEPHSNNGHFGLISSAEGRWRVYVLPFTLASGTFSGYIEVLAPLERLDSSIASFRLILILLAVVGAAASLVGGRVLAGRALEPVNRIADTAEQIALSRDLARRVEVHAKRDELAKLAVTFNEMLQNLEEAYRWQQRFVSDASHELRAPLTAIQGNLEILLRHRQLAESEREEALSEAAREASRLSRLVADLLALARADAGVGIKLGPVDLDGVVMEAFRTAKPLAKGQQLKIETLEPIKVAGDEDRLKQLLLIFLDNAIHYTPAAGEINISLGREGAAALLQVKDSGMGIGEKDLPHLFDRFYRADPARGRDPGGTGLGLSIAKWIVEQHSGRIEIQSQPGQGTTVSVSLPLLQASSPT